MTHTVRFEPVGIEMEVEEGETVLDAAFRQGVSLMHGCKEGQCGSCKSQLIEGDIELLRYSTFALPEYERETNHVLLCRTHAYSDLTVELLNFDEDLLRRSIAVKRFGAVTKVTPLTHDIRKLEIALEKPMKFWAGQYFDITHSRPRRHPRLLHVQHTELAAQTQFIIKKYPERRVLRAARWRASGRLAVSPKVLMAAVSAAKAAAGAMILVGGGSGMSPLWSILNDHVASGEDRPVRFFYGARTKADFSTSIRSQTLPPSSRDFKFIPALSDAAPGDEWQGEKGFIHEVVARTLRAEKLHGEMDAYACGPPAMIDAVLPVLQMAGVEPMHIHFDKFTQPHTSERRQSQNQLGQEPTTRMLI